MNFPKKVFLLYIIHIVLNPDTISQHQCHTTNTLIIFPELYTIMLLFLGCTIKMEYWIFLIIQNQQFLYCHANQSKYFAVSNLYEKLTLSGNNLVPRLFTWKYILFISFNNIFMIWTISNHVEHIQITNIVNFFCNHNKDLVVLLYFYDLIFLVNQFHAKNFMVFLILLYAFLFFLMQKFIVNLYLALYIHYHNFLLLIFAIQHIVLSIFFARACNCIYYFQYAYFYLLYYLFHNKFASQ